MITKEDLLGMSRRDLKGTLAKGHPIEAEELSNREYHGISLGLPRWAEKLSWKKFKKVFRREQFGGLRGWNVAVVDNSRLSPGPAGSVGRDSSTGNLCFESASVALRPRNGLDEDWIDAKRGNVPITYWHYVVVPAQGHLLPGPYEEGLLIHYGWGGNSRLSTMRPIRDPLLAVNEGSNELLLGYSYLDFGFARFDTPTFFCLIRGGPLNYDVPPPRTQHFPERTGDE
ncbi:MAG: hypothetical protein HN348_11965 [Proteobacteria bacterium]|jgi:hypothetical protein|nr:hypothetical protein [Pseudomonadota bacterium]